MSNLTERERFFRLGRTPVPFLRFGVLDFMAEGGGAGGVLSPRIYICIRRLRRFSEDAVCLQAFISGFADKYSIFGGGWRLGDLRGVYLWVRRAELVFCRGMWLIASFSMATLYLELRIRLFLAKD